MFCFYQFSSPSASAFSLISHLNKKKNKHEHGHEQQTQQQIKITNTQKTKSPKLYNKQIKKKIFGLFDFAGLGWNGISMIID
jgi:hypothetical protein